MIFDQLKEIVTSAIDSIDILIGHVRSERGYDDQYFVSFFNSMNGHEDAHDDDTSVPLDSHLFDGAALNPTSSYSYREDASLPILNQSRCRSDRIVDRVIDTSGRGGGGGVCAGRNNNEGKQRLVSWDNDESLKGSVMAIKDAAKALSNDYLKLALLVATVTASSQESLTGLVEELCSCTKAFIHSYFMFLERSYSDCLFDSVTRLVRGVLYHLQELIDTIQSATATATAPYVHSNALVFDRHSLDKINYLTGMVLGVKADIDKLPVDNRQSYRKFLLEQCLSINETCKEFRGYVDEARRKKCNADEEVDRGDPSFPEDSIVQSGGHSSSNGTKKNEKYSEKEDKYEYDDDDGNNNDADDNDNDDEEELDYTELEVRMVDLCVLLIARCVEVIKQSIAVVTVVNDALSRSSTHDTPLVTVFQTHSLSDNPSFSMWEYSSRWVAHVASLSTEVNTKVLDLGAELYPPFADDLQQIQTLAQALSVEVTQFIRKAVAVEPLGDKIGANVKPMLIKMQQLLIEVSSCEEDISKLC
jgi:hypothetical protein